MQGPGRTGSAALGSGAGIRPQGRDLVGPRVHGGDRETVVLPAEAEQAVTHRARNAGCSGATAVTTLVWILSTPPHEAADAIVASGVPRALFFQEGEALGSARARLRRGIAKPWLLERPQQQALSSPLRAVPRSTASSRHRRSSARRMRSPAHIRSPIDKARRRRNRFPRLPRSRPCRDRGRAR